MTIAQRLPSLSTRGECFFRLRHKADDASSCKSSLAWKTTQLEHAEQQITDMQEKERDAMESETSTPVGNDEKPQEEAPAPSQPEEGATKAEGEHAAPVPAEGEHAAPMPAEGEGEHEPEGEHKPEDEGEHKHAGGEGEHTSEGKGEPKPAEEKAAEDKASEAKPEDEAAEAKPEPKEITEDSLNLVNYVTKKGFPEAEVKAMVKVRGRQGKANDKLQEPQTRSYSTLGL
eukprot:gnl/TRDRNA2_/TRDRNA2_170204_c0_seq4.p1 gnl/TRDRNA2_/TRDRNA2_170204_c0~~gnl/TRDRNA2_/TRDRNA2_170204_c0_seq4.p1  ORF type:complete len:230 (+),score=54.56 gnl/TRDRNA2_/TRDRNA2_170204_c0_seq4:258-947(+)